MNLKKCLFIDNIATNRESILVVLKTTKTIMTLTIGAPVVDWCDFNNGILVYGNDREMQGMELVLGQTLGITTEDAEISMCPNLVTPIHQPVNEMANVAVMSHPVVDHTETVQRVASELGNITVGGAVGVVGSVNGAGNIPVERVSVSDTPIDSAAVVQRISGYETGALLNAMRAYYEPSNLGSDEEESYEIRRHTAERERHNLEQVQHTNEWRLEFNRRNIQLIPTESNSGTISPEEQAEYSENFNPRRWNIAKCSYGTSSRFYLSYLVPPTATIEDTLRVVGGPHDGATPTVREICVFNTPEYWKELRHLMHRQADYLREMAC